MAEDIKIGVYICHCGINIASVVDVGEVTKYAETLPNVVVARNYKYTCSDPGQDTIRKDIKELGLNRVVVAACSPRMHEPTYRRVCESVGLNPYLFEMANIREHCAWVTIDHAAATEKAKSLVRAAVKRVALQEPLTPREIPVNPNVLVVGAGIAGMQAALEIADAERQVYLVEKEASIGGHMAQLDKTFPTLDCAACISTPRMSQVGSHPFIDLYSYSEVVDVDGHIGNFKVKIKRKPRYIGEDPCTGCGDCEKVCPVEVPSEFNLGLTKRKATYRPFPQAVPNVYTIDRRGLPPCRFTCPAGVNAQGYVALISQGKFEEALDVLRRTMPFAGVCGRVCTHPCESECERGKVDSPIAIRALKRFMADQEIKEGCQKVEPIKQTKKDKVAVVGSGPAGIACAYDLVKNGYPVTVFEAEVKAGGMLRYGIPSYRLPDDILDNDISYATALGVEIRAESPVKDSSELFGQGYKAIFLASGASSSLKLGIPGEDATGVSYAIDFLKQVNAGEKPEAGKKVIVIGGGSVALDAARTAIRLGAGEVHLVCLETRDMEHRDKMLAQEQEIAEAEEEGLIIHSCLGPKEIMVKGGKVYGLATMNCCAVRDEEGRFAPQYNEEDAPVIEADSIIVAIGQKPTADSFSEVEKTKRQTIAADSVTLETNINGLFAGGDDVSGPSTVINAVAQGKEAAVSIGRFLSGQDLKEGRPEPKERVKDISKEGVVEADRAEVPMLDAAERRSFAEVEQVLSEEAAVAEAKRCLNCGVCSDCQQCVIACEAKAIDFNQKDEFVEIEVGNIIMATGFKSFDPSVMTQYGYGRHDNVITGLQFERMANASGPTGGEILLKNGQKPESVAIVHCVGSRDKNYHEYCSQICCMHSLKHAHLIKDRTGADIYQMYIDIRCTGKGYEEFYDRVSEEGVNFIRGKVTRVTDRAINEEEKGKLIVECEDTLLSSPIRVPVDMVILSTALEPQKDAEKVGQMFNIVRSADGFFLEKHPKLDPVAAMSDGVFIVGCAQGPKDIPQSVTQASAAAARALATISKGRVVLEPCISQVIDENCDGCAYCVDPCPFDAITLVEYMKNGAVKKTVQSDPVKCHGCGICQATCPKKGITVKNFKLEQIQAMVDALVGAA